MAAQRLAGAGHAVTLHARDEERAGDARQALPSAKHIIIGDLASIAGMRQVAEEANRLGRYDAVLHTMPGSVTASPSASRPWTGCRTSSP